MINNETVTFTNNYFNHDIVFGDICILDGVNVIEEKNRTLVKIVNIDSDLISPYDYLQNVSIYEVKGLIETFKIAIKSFSDNLHLVMVLEGKGVNFNYWENPNNKLKYERAYSLSTINEPKFTGKFDNYNNCYIYGKSKLTRLKITKAINEKFIAELQFMYAHDYWNNFLDKDVNEFNYWRWKKIGYSLEFNTIEGAKEKFEKDLEEIKIIEDGDIVTYVGVDGKEHYAYMEIAYLYDDEYTRLSAFNISSEYEFSDNMIEELIPFSREYNTNLIEFKRDDINLVHDVDLLSDILLINKKKLDKRLKDLHNFLVDDANRVTELLSYDKAINH